MIPIVSAPSVQVAPPVETSVFTGQNSDAALGRLPVVTVPPTISNAKVADNKNGQQQLRSPQTPDAPKADSALSGFSLAGNGELAFESPYSTTFVAQLFGQFQTADDSLGDMGGESVNVPLGFVDFDKLSQFDITKYMPSFAFRPPIETPPAKIDIPIESTEPQPASTGLQQAPVTAEESQPEAPQIAVAQAASAPAAASPETTDFESLQSLATAAGIDLSRTAPISTDAEPAAQPAAPQEAPPVIATPTLFSSGFEAYSSTQSRNLVAYANAGRGSSELSLVL